MITTLKEFGRGQITLPKKWREKFKTDLYIAKEISQGLLIIPLTDNLITVDEKNLKAGSKEDSLFRKKSIRKKRR